MSIKIRKRRLIGCMLVLSGMILIWIHQSQMEQLNRLEKKENKVSQIFQELQLEEQQLKVEIKNLNDDTYLADIARRDYFLSKSNEVIFVLPEKNFNDVD